jgi:hypothetical protein
MPRIRVCLRSVSEYGLVGGARIFCRGDSKLIEWQSKNIEVEWFGGMVKRYRNDG